VLRGAAGLGAVGLAAAAGVGAVAAATRPANAAPRAATSSAAGAAAQASTDPLVVYLRDASVGEFEVFRGTQQVKVRDPRLVAQLLDGIAAAQ